MPNYTCAGHEYKHSREAINSLVRDYECLNCKTKIEFFWDDDKRECSNCNTTVEKPLVDLIKDMHQSCVTSCAQAQYCKPGLYKKFKTLIERLSKNK